MNLTSEILLGKQIYRHSTMNTCDINTLQVLLSVGSGNLKNVTSFKGLREHKLRIQAVLSLLPNSAFSNIFVMTI